MFVKKAKIILSYARWACQYREWTYSARMTGGGGVTDAGNPKLIPHWYHQYSLLLQHSRQSELFVLVPSPRMRKASKLYELRTKLIVFTCSVQWVLCNTPTHTHPTSQTRWYGAKCLEMKAWKLLGAFSRPITSRKPYRCRKRLQCFTRIAAYYFEVRIRGTAVVYVPYFAYVRTFQVAFSMYILVPCTCTVAHMPVGNAEPYARSKPKAWTGGKGIRPVTSRLVEKVAERMLPVYWPRK